MKHTPGNWHSNGTLIVATQPDGKDYIVATTGLQFRSQPTSPDADARFIASAPALSVALDECVAALEFVKANFCASPFPGRCVICRNGNLGVGFDYCYLRTALDAGREARAEL